MPSVLAIAPVLGSEWTTTPLTTKSTLSAPTRTSRALVDFPLASGFFTASLGVFGDTMGVAPPSRLLSSHVPSCATTKYR